MWVVYKFFRRTQMQVMAENCFTKIENNGLWAACEACLYRIVALPHISPLEVLP
jgi:hypothetical protein